MLYNSGARVSEIIGVKVNDIIMDEATCVQPPARQGAQTTHDINMKKYSSGNQGVADLTTNTAHVCTHCAMHIICAS
jgi:integrase